jgi:hypothetical protein
MWSDLKNTFLNTSSCYYLCYIYFKLFFINEGDEMPDLPPPAVVHVLNLKLFSALRQTFHHFTTMHNFVLYKIVGKPEGRRPLGRPRRSWVDNIKMNLREIGWDGMDWIDLAQDRDQWRAIVNTIMNLRVP